VPGNWHTGFGKRPMEKDPTMGTSLAAHFTQWAGAGNGSITHHRASPRDPTRPTARRRCADAAFRDSAAWLATVRAPGRHDGLALR
jgi:hypothetical protein